MMINRGRPKFNWLGTILLAVALALIAGALCYKGPPYVQEISPTQLTRLVESGRLSVSKEHPLELVVDDQQSLQYLTGYYKNPQTPGQDVRFKAPVSMEWNTELREALNTAGLQPVVRAESNLVASIMLGFLPIAIFLLVSTLSLVLAVALAKCAARRPGGK
jgi:hypothetical protein